MNQFIIRFFSYFWVNVIDVFITDFKEGYQRFNTFICDKNIQ